MMEKFQLQAKYLQPWSTFVMNIQLPPSILEKMIKITDEILENKEPTKRAGKTLVGQIEDEFWIAPNMLERENLMEFFLDVCKQYVIQAFFQSQPFEEEMIIKEKWITKLVNMWMVSQKDHEYNPVHTHTGCDISGVMYLKIPEYLPSRKSHRSDDGAICFVNNSATNNKDYWGSPSLTLHPAVGDFYIFPASQQHLVYPFRTADGKGERRSVSFNAEFTPKTHPIWGGI